ncbi:MAG TPA: TetR/AcrR family transcriptional regulator [Polyangiaceae bacterium]|nr:TetR/AcrR family transcriptional regulator [Polyangiaceae bacterium]
MPRDTLTREQIVDAAIELLDARGLDDFGMRTLGKRLGSAATAMYWHVGSKDDLLALAADRVWSEIALPDPAVTGWRAAATQMATGLYAALTRHPWLVQTFGSLVLYGPGKARHDDHGLAVYEAAGFAGADADRAATAVFTFVLGNALGVAAATTLARRGKTGMRATLANAKAIAAQYPRLRARLETPAARHGASPAGAFQLGLEALLDGLEARLPARRKPASRRA